MKMQWQPTRDTALALRPSNSNIREREWVVLMQMQWQPTGDTALALRPSKFQYQRERERVARAHANAMAVYRGHSTHKLQALAHVGFVGGIYRNRVLYNTIELYFSSIV
jgi:hypothetical protein